MKCSDSFAFYYSYFQNPAYLDCFSSSQELQGLFPFVHKAGLIPPSTPLYCQVCISCPLKQQNRTAWEFRNTAAKYLASPLLLSVPVSF